MSTAVLQPGEIQPGDDDIQRMLDEVEKVLELDAIYRAPAIDVVRGVDSIIDRDSGMIHRGLGGIATSSFIRYRKPEIVETSEGVYFFI